MFHAIGNFCYRFRWIVIAVWVVLFGVSVVATPLLANVLTAGFTNPNAPSQEAAAAIQKTFKQGETNLLVVFKATPRRPPATSSRRPSRRPWTR